MTLDKPEFVKVATSLQNFAIQNKSPQNNKDIYLVYGEENIIPPYNENTFKDAFIIRSIDEPSSIMRSEIPGAVYVAPVSSFAILGIKVWTA
jgi:hypothetical protein